MDQKHLKTNKHFFSLEQGDLLPVLLMLPSVLIIVFVMIIPLFFGLFMSLFNYNIGTFEAGRDFIGFGNYTRLFKDPLLIKSLVNTLYFTLGAVAGDLVLGTIIAVLLNNLSRGLSAFLRPIYAMPLLVSPIIIGLIWRYLYDPGGGFIYWVLGKVGITIRDFPGITGTSTAMLSVIIAHWWQVTPFVIIVVTAGLVSIPQEYYEAAHVDGARGFKKFFLITLPQLKSVYMVIMLLSGVDAIKVFDIIFALTGGGPNNSTLSMSLYAFKSGFNMYEMGYAMAISNVAMLVSFILFGVGFITFNRRQSATY